MAPETQRDAPIGEIAQHLAPGNNSHNMPQNYWASVLINGTANGTGTYWQNPHSFPVLVRNVGVVVKTAGTGTIDVGVGTGTALGTDASFIDGGTFAAGARVAVDYVATAADPTAGLAGRFARGLGSNGAAGDAVVVRHTTTDAVARVVFEVVAAF